MNNRILIAYASATGSTQEVAAEIAKTLGARGFSVDVKPVREGPPVEDYRAVLIGSAVRYGSWLPEAMDFVRRNQEKLRRLPVVLFCVHIQNLEDDWQSRKGRLAYLDAVRLLVDRIEEGYFAGRFDRHGAALLMPRLLARFIPTIDRRNWDKIHLWADQLGVRLLQAA